MSQKLTAEQLAELKAAFTTMDENKDGQITADELKKLLTGLGEKVTDEVVEEMIGLADQDGDNKVNFKEFCDAATSGNM